MSEAEMTTADDVFAEAKRKFGDGWMDVLGAYQCLAESRGLPVVDVIRAALADDLASIVAPAGGVTG